MYILQRIATATEKYGREHGLPQKTTNDVYMLNGKHKFIFIELLTKPQLIPTIIKLSFNQKKYTNLFKAAFVIEVGCDE